MAPFPSFTLSLALPDEAATERLGHRVAGILRPGDTIALGGTLGVGKTTLARAAIRALTGDPALDVPSPTFTIAQSYPDGRVPVTHVDLYRLAASTDLEEIGLDEALAQGAALVEWPERAAGFLSNPLHIDLALGGRGRIATIYGHSDWAERAARLIR